jgi:hypothetical protein
MLNPIVPLRAYADSLCNYVTTPENEVSSNLETFTPKLFILALCFLCFCALLGALTPYLIGNLFFDWVPFANAENLKYVINDSAVKSLNYHLDENHHKLFMGSLTTMPIAIIFLIFSLSATKAKENTWRLSTLGLYGIGMAVALVIIFLQGTMNADLVIPLISIFLSQFLGITLYILIHKKIIVVERVQIYFLICFPLWVLFFSNSSIRNYFGMEPQPAVQIFIDVFSYLLIFILTHLIIFIFESLSKQWDQPRPKWIKWRFAHVIAFNTLAVFIFLLSIANTKDKNVINKF